MLFTQAFLMAITFITRMCESTVFPKFICHGWRNMWRCNYPKQLSSISLFPEGRCSRKLLKRLLQCICRKFTTLPSEKYWKNCKLIFTNNKRLCYYYLWPIDTQHIAEIFHRLITYNREVQRYCIPCCELSPFEPI